MSSFTHEQDQFLRKHFTEMLESNYDQELIQKIKDLQILESIDKSSYEESVTNDVIMVLEDMQDLKLTEDQKDDVICHVANMVMSNYSYSDYNEYISYAITEYLKEAV